MLAASEKVENIYAAMALLAPEDSTVKKEVSLIIVA